MDFQSIDANKKETAALKRALLPLLKKLNLAPTDRAELRFLVSSDGVIHASQWTHFVRNERRQ